MIVGSASTSSTSRASPSRWPHPRAGERLFTPGETVLGIASLAARFAAKEAMAKALGAPGNMPWHDAEVVSEESGRPVFEIRGTVAGPGRRRSAPSTCTSRCRTTPASRRRWWCWRADLAWAAFGQGGLPRRRLARVAGRGFGHAGRHGLPSTRTEGPPDTPGTTLGEDGGLLTTRDLDGAERRDRRRHRRPRGCSAFENKTEISWPGR